MLYDEADSLFSSTELFCAGKVRVTVVPRATALVAVAEPPCRSVMDFTKARPKPVPLELRDESTR